jgi:hypothetical protein
MAYDNASETIDMEQMVSREPLDAQSIEYNPILSYIPPQLWPHVFKTFIRGYGSIFKAIAQLLSRFILPTESTIRAELQNGQMEYFDVQAAQFYFSKGGRIEYALDAIVDSTKNNLDLAGSMLDLYEDDKRLRETPSCANDREFDIIRQNIGLNPTQTWGPYSTSRRHVGWPIGSDDSDAEEEDASDEDVAEDSEDCDDDADEEKNGGKGDASDEEMDDE